MTKLSIIFGLVLVIAVPLSALQSATSPATACALLTQAEATAIMGQPSAAPRIGAFASNTCAMQSEKSPATVYINIGLDTEATLKTQGMPDPAQAFAGMKRGADDAEVLNGVGDAAFFSKKMNGIYIVKGARLGYVLIAPELGQSAAAIVALKKLAPAIASRMQ